MNRERLVKLADLLDCVPEDKFDMTTWGNPGCGTAGCAIGYAGTLLEFRQQGFRLSDSSYPMFCDGGMTFINWQAVEEFFRLTEDGAAFLFMDSRYETRRVKPCEVAERIRYFVGLAT